MRRFLACIALLLWPLSVSAQNIWYVSFPPDYCTNVAGLIDSAAPQDTSYHNHPATTLPHTNTTTPFSGPYLLCPFTYPPNLPSGVRTFYVDLIWQAAQTQAAQYVRFQTDIQITNWGSQLGALTYAGGAQNWAEAQSAVQSLNSGQPNTDIITRTSQQPHVFEMDGGGNLSSSACDSTTCALKHGTLRIQREYVTPAYNASITLTSIMVWAYLP